MVQFSLHADLDLWEALKQPRWKGLYVNNKRALSLGAHVTPQWDPASTITIWEIKDLFLPAEETWHCRFYNV